MSTWPEQGVKVFRRLAAELGKLDGELDQHRDLFQEVARRRLAVRVTAAEASEEG